MSALSLICVYVCVYGNHSQHCSLYQCVNQLWVEMNKLILCYISSSDGRPNKILKICVNSSDVSSGLIKHSVQPTAQLLTPTAIIKTLAVLKLYEKKTTLIVT